MESTSLLSWIFGSMALSKVVLGVAGVVAGAAVITNLPAAWFMTVEKVTLAYLKNAKLRTLDKAPRDVKVRIVH